MKKLFKKLRKNNKGQTATEYMLIIAVLVLVVVGAAQIFGANVSGAITGMGARIANTLGAANP